MSSHKKKVLKHEKLILISAFLIVLVGSLSVTHGLIPLDVTNGTFLRLPFFCIDPSYEVNGSPYVCVSPAGQALISNYQIQKSAPNPPATSSGSLSNNIQTSTYSGTSNPAYYLPSERTGGTNTAKVYDPVSGTYVTNTTSTLNQPIKNDPNTCTYTTLAFIVHCPNELTSSTSTSSQPISTQANGLPKSDTGSHIITTSSVQAPPTCGTDEVLTANGCTSASTICGTSGYTWSSDLQECVKNDFTSLFSPIFSGGSTTQPTSYGLPVISNSIPSGSGLQLKCDNGTKVTAVFADHVECGTSSSQSSSSIDLSFINNLFSGNNFYILIFAVAFIILVVVVLKAKSKQQVKN